MFLTNNSQWKTLNNLSTASSLIAPYKRKGFEVDGDDLISFQPPNKQNATEEKVIGKFNKLTIDEEFEDSDEFIIALDQDETIDDKNFNDCSNDDFEFETTDSILNENDVKFELSDDIQDYWQTDDVITKLVKDQQEKDSKALVLWQPPIDYPLKLTENNESKKKTEIVDQTDDYIVYSETDDVKETDFIDNNNDNSGLEIIELDELCDLKSNDEEMMEI